MEVAGPSSSASSSSSSGARAGPSSSHCTPRGKGGPNVAYSKLYSKFMYSILLYLAHANFVKLRNLYISKFQRIK